MIIIIFLLLSVVASEATKTNAASSEGGRGWSVARATTIFTSKTLARFRALVHNQARGGGGWRLNVFTDKEFHPPSARLQALPAFSSDLTSKPSWGSSRLPARRHAMRPNRSCRDVVHYVLLSFVDIVFHGIQTSLIECLLKRRVDPATAWAPVGHHICNSSSCPVMEALQCSPHSISHSPRLTAKQ